MTLSHISNFGGAHNCVLSLSPGCNNDRVYIASVVIDLAIELLITNPSIPLFDYLTKHAKLDKVFVVAAPSDDQLMVMKVLSEGGTKTVTRYTCVCGCIFSLLCITVIHIYLTHARCVHCSKYVHERRACVSCSLNVYV